MTSNTEKRLIRVLDYIHDDPAGDLSLDKLADVAALSRFHFHRTYRSVTGETAVQAVRRIRLYRAAVALAQGSDCLGRIAASVGYPLAASFSRVFSESYGQSPLAFRNQNQLRRSHAQEQRTKTMYPIEIRDEPARRLAAITHTGAYDKIGHAFEKLAATIGSRGLLPQTGKIIAVYYNDAQISEAALRSHASFEVGRATPITAPLQEVMLPAGRYAVLRFKGPYPGLPAAFDHLVTAWLPSSGEVVAKDFDHTPTFDIHLNSPLDTAPEDLLTEICLPLA